MHVDREEIPKQVRVRTDPDDGYAHRYDTIRGAADRFDCNNTDAILRACESAGPLLDNVQEALADERLPPELAKELAEIISTTHIKVEYSFPEVETNVK